MPELPNPKSLITTDCIRPKESVMDASVAALCVSVLGLLTSIVRWFVIQRLAFKNQEKALINSLRNDARIAITDAINECCECLIEIDTSASAAGVDTIFEEIGDLSARSRRCRQLGALCVDSRTYIWIRRLEEYESLFPGTATVRVDLLHRVRVVIDRVQKFVADYETGSVSHESPELDAISNELHDMISLAWDVMVYIQNRSIGAITGHAVPARKPMKSDYPILIEDSLGQLTISQSN